MLEEIAQEIAFIPFLSKRAKDALNTLVAEISRQRKELDELREKIINLERK